MTSSALASPDFMQDIDEAVSYFANTLGSPRARQAFSMVWTPRSPESGSISSLGPTHKTLGSRAEGIERA